MTARTSRSRACAMVSAGLVRQTSAMKGGRFFSAPMRSRNVFGAGRGGGGGIAPIVTPGTDPDLRPRDPGPSRVCSTRREAVRELAAAARAADRHDQPGRARRGLDLAPDGRHDCREAVGERDRAFKMVGSDLLW